MGRTLTCTYCQEGFGLHMTFCPMVVRPSPQQPIRSQRGYLPPSRAGRATRQEYLDEVSVSRDHKLAVHREKQRRYRERKRAAKG